MKKFVKMIPAVLLATQVSWAQSVNQGSNQAGGSNDAGKAAAQAMQAMLQALSAMEKSQCGPQNPGACAMAALHAMMAALAGMQAGEHGGVSGEAANTAANTYGSTSTSDSTISRADDGGTGNLTAVDDNLKKLINSIDGAKYDAKTGAISYNGTNLNNVDPTSPASLSAAGFSDSQIAQVLALNDKLNKAVSDKLGALTASNGYDEAGGGGGAGAAGSAKSSSLMVAALKLDRNPANVAGMQKNFNGEPIGVSGDNIFDMMTRRYKTKERQSAFYDDLDLALKQK